MDQSDGMVELDGKDWTIMSRTGPESCKGRKTKDSNQMMDDEKREAHFMPSYSLQTPSSHPTPASTPCSSVLHTFYSTNLPLALPFSSNQGMKWWT